jgi:hypothetical protein
VELLEWLRTRPVGIAHRDLAVAQGATVPQIRAAVRAGEVRAVRRQWLATPEATGELVAAATHGARVG